MKSLSSGPRSSARIQVVAPKLALDLLGLLTEDDMDRRSFLNLAIALGCTVAAGAAMVATPSSAAPLSPAPLADTAPAAVTDNVQRALTTADEVGQLAPQQVHWGHHGYHGRGHHWGWRHHHWHHRHWGWHHRHHGWHHHHWHRHW
ncbi:conserved hypothetical protein [Bradyrhizobium sp. STM 3843]|uniref:hypothetical protein n=1 Tax=Bradyrhizobium sp. STM 3843 TaxID=551947 RepID=UPI0002404CE9|nr:conserved hypothetical protein [Bradyrhizobium sp. STM 3843]